MSQNLSRKARTAGTSALVRAGLDGNGRFYSISSALCSAFQALTSLGIEPADIVSADMVMGDRGQRTVDLAFGNAADPFSPVSIANSLLAFSWTRLESGYEVIAYLS